MSGSPTILTESDFAARVRNLASHAAICRVAVGYCGAEGYTFFPEAPGDWPPEFRVLVDASENAVSAGLTNPDGLSRLLGLGATIKSIEGLHSKVYAFDNTAALVGSVNLSAHAVEAQIQLALGVTDSATVTAVNRWFDRLWASVEDLLSPDDLAALKKLWPKHRAPVKPVRRNRQGPAKKWKHPPDAPLPEPSFEIGLSKTVLKEVLRRFRTSPCKYRNYEGQTCVEASHSIAGWYQDKSEEFHRLYRHRNRWTREDLAELHRLAFLNGKNAAVGRPRFVRQDPQKVAERVTYLLEGDGDPYIRLERVLDRNSKEAVPGFGLGAWACLMHLWDPKSFAIFNEPVLDALKALKVKAGSATVHRKAAKYRNLSEAVKYLAKELQLGNLSRADHFFDGLGKKHFTVPRK